MDTPKQESPVKEEPKKTAPTPEKAGAGVCVYIGPTIVGVIQANTIYPGRKSEVVSRPPVSFAVAKYPEIATLIVDGSTLSRDQIRVKTKGDALYQAYRAIIKR